MRIGRVEDVRIGATVRVGHEEATVVGIHRPAARPPVLSLADGRLVDPEQDHVRVVALGGWRAGVDLERRRDPLLADLTLGDEGARTGRGPLT